MASTGEDIELAYVSEYLARARRLRVMAAESADSVMYDTLDPFQLFQLLIPNDRFGIGAAALQDARSEASGASEAGVIENSP